MTFTSQVTTAARIVRTAALAMALSLLVGFVAVQAFVSRYGDPAATTVVLDASSGDTVLSAAIAVQESDGLRCSQKPSLTDVVLFQREVGAEVTVLTFDQAIEASAARTGWIRRYCV